MYNEKTENMKAKIRNTFMGIMLFSAIVLFPGCDSESNSMEARIDLTMQAQTTQGTVAAARSATSGYTFNTVLLGLAELELETLEESKREDQEGEDENEEIEFEGEFVVDLLAGTSTPDFGIADIAPGLYEEVEFELEPFIEDQHSIFVGFSFTDANNETVEVEYTFDEEIEFEIENDNGFQLDGGVANQILVVFDLDALFAQVDLSNATVDSDGVIRINSNSNANIASTIESNLETAIEAMEEDDDDEEDDYDDEDDD